MKMLEIDDNYFKDVKKYTKKDAYISLTFYFGMLLIYYIMGYIYKVYQTNLDIIINVLLVVACIIIVKWKKQKLASLGITKKNLLKSLNLGIITGITVLILNNIENLNALYNLNSLSTIIRLSIYYFIVIAFTEEVIFRGYIQTRMHALIKNKIICISVVGVLFMLLHIPFRLFLSELDIITFLSDNFISLGMTFIWHFAFNFLYKKYNSIVAPTIFHGFMNLSNYLFY